MDEDQINNMSYNFFEDVLLQLGHKLQYDAVVNYAGNSFCEKSWEMIADANPMNTGQKSTKTSTMNSLANFFTQNSVQIAPKGEIKLPGKGFNGRDKRGV